MRDTATNIIDLAAVRRRLASTTLAVHLRGPRVRSCLCCSREFVSACSGNRICTDCRVTDDAAAAT